MRKCIRKLIQNFLDRIDPRGQSQFQASLPLGSFISHTPFSGEIRSFFISAVISATTQRKPAQK
jgi:hypothetical protein